MLYGSAFRRLAVGRIAILALGGIVAAAAVVYLWKPWRKPPAVARVVLTQPMPRYEPPPRFAVDVPDSPRAENFEPGPPACVETLVAETPKADREVRERFALKPDEPILSLSDFPRFRWGGDLVATERDGRVGVTMRGFKAPWLDAEWRHDVVFTYGRLWPGGGALDVRAFGYEPVELTIKDRLRLYPSAGRLEIPGTTIDGPYFWITGKLAVGKRERR